jgi:hypothetical protein
MVFILKNPDFMPIKDIHLRSRQNTSKKLKQIYESTKATILTFHINFLGFILLLSYLNKHQSLYLKK